MATLSIWVQELTCLWWLLCWLSLSYDDNLFQYDWFLHILLFAFPSCLRPDRPRCEAESESTLIYWGCSTPTKWSCAYRTSQSRHFDPDKKILGDSLESIRSYPFISKVGLLVTAFKMVVEGQRKRMVPIWASACKIFALPCFEIHSTLTTLSFSSLAMPQRPLSRNSYLVKAQLE